MNLIAKLGTALIALRGTPRPECWAIQQNQAKCISAAPTCQWCNLGPEYGEFCAPAGPKNCYAFQYPELRTLNRTEQKSVENCVPPTCCIPPSCWPGCPNCW